MCPVALSDLRTSTKLQCLKGDAASKERIEEAGTGNQAEKWACLLKESKMQEAEFQSDCNLNRLEMADENDPHKYLDYSISALSNKLEFAEKELSSKLKESLSLKRQLDALPIEAELVQYERRFSELNVQMQDRLHQTRKYYETYNALLEMKELMQKEISLLNSVESQFGDAIGNPAGRTKLIDSMEAILKGIQQKLQKVQPGLQVKQKTLDALREQYSAAITNKRHCSILLKDFQEECRKNEMLKKELGIQEKQRGQSSS